MPDDPEPTTTPHGDLAALVALLNELGPAIAPSSLTEQLTAVCATARAAFGATAASVAAVVGDELEYRASVGPGAAELIGLRLPVGRGIAGFVVSSGQGISVDEVRDDPRFAADVAERTGYVPAAILAVPIVRRDEAIGVLSILDRVSADGGPSLELAGHLAEVAAIALGQADLFTDLGRVFATALAGVAGDEDLPAALRAAASTALGASNDLGDLAALYGELAQLGPAERAAATRIVAEFTSYAASTRRRRRR